MPPLRQGKGITIAGDDVARHDNIGASGRKFRVWVAPEKRLAGRVYWKAEGGGARHKSNRRGVKLVEGGYGRWCRQGIDVVKNGGGGGDPEMHTIKTMGARWAGPYVVFFRRQCPYKRIECYMG
jgi:hypothetical protein